MRRRLLFIVPAALLGMVAFVFVGGEVVKLLWNWLVPQLAGWREITFWEALGVLALCRILFGGPLHAGSRAHPSVRRRMADRMVDRIAERWEQMSPEERERFRQRVRERCGFDPAAAEGRSQ